MLKQHLQIPVIYKKCFTFILTCFFLPACQAQDPPGQSHTLLTKAKAGELVLEVINLNGKCGLKLNNESKALDVPYPCGFVRTRKNKPAQSYQYNDIGRVFVIAGPPAKASSYSPSAGVKPEYLCSNYGQAIIIYDNKVTLRKNREIALGYCHLLGFDEKDYYGFAYPVD